MKKISNLFKVFVLSFGLVFCSCSGDEKNSDKPEENKKEETRETADDSKEEVSNDDKSEENNLGTVENAQDTDFGKGITYYMNQYKEKFLKDVPKTPESIKEEINDKNGYAKYTYSQGMADMTVEMGLWVTTGKKEIIGVFNGTKGGMSDGATPKELKFYDTQWNEITADVVDVAAIESITIKVKGKINQFQAKMPKSGLTIVLEDQGKDGKRVKIGELQFDMATGKFKLVK